MHFKWKDRTSGTVEDDLIIFPVTDFLFDPFLFCSAGFTRDLSSIGLGFFNPTSLLKRWDVTSFCMQ